MSASVPGAQGYEQAADRFVELSRSLEFGQVCQAFLPFLPTRPARVLDAGSGAGQNAAALAQLGHSVTAVEPIQSFVNASAQTYGTSVNWLCGHLPELTCIGNQSAFDFILLEGVWHHLDAAERRLALKRLAELLAPGGHIAMSLRNGPAGLGTWVFATDSDTTIRDAAGLGLRAVLHLQNQPSLLRNKADVTWSRLVLTHA